MSHDDETLLVRDLMRRTADELPALPDLTPEAVRLGRRRRTRLRTAAFAGVAGAAAACVAALPLPGPWAGEPGGAAPAAPAHAVPSRGPGTTQSGQLQEFQQRTAATLGATLGGRLGTIQPEADRADRYRAAGGVGADTFLVVITVRPAYSDPPRCVDIPEKHSRCASVTLPDGTVGAFRTEPMDGGPLTGVSFTHAHEGSEVELAVHPDHAVGLVPPITVEQLAEAAEDARLLTALRRAAGSPLFEEGRSDG
ncbi:hypothetical protein [Streptomyces abyssomicinicus]|uniref:hypothetical protein n=1 Tax=Streptomyces abyssomicinicus TaxID=574929 RepID=UPI00124F9114|nr:hypothetical protein [Streptomyces abyssomicinicus]